MKKAGLLSQLIVEDLGEDLGDNGDTFGCSPTVITHVTSHQQQEPIIAIQVAARCNTRSTVFAC